MILKKEIDWLNTRLREIGWLANQSKGWDKVAEELGFKEKKLYTDELPDLGLARELYASSIELMKNNLKDRNMEIDSDGDFIIHQNHKDKEIPDCYKDLYKKL